jgi:hypothetical protein
MNYLFCQIDFSLLRLIDLFWLIIRYVTDVTFNFRISVRSLHHLTAKIVQVGKKHNQGFPDFRIGI